MFCSRCGTEVQTQAKFCPTCGLDLSTTTPMAAVAPTAAPREATELDAVREALRDEWDIQKELGRGGMAIVYKALDRQLDREVAIKVLPFSLAFDQEFVERFQREARTAARLEHPHIIPIYRVGKSGNIIYFVMKFLRGSSLSDRLEQRSTLPPGEIRKLLIEAAKALGYAHKHGIVHRDIKPDNMMFDEGDHVVIMDFGIAKAATGTRLTGTGMSIGTPHYMSPEQARAQKLDGRSDVYSLGVVAYQCLTGHVPFDGEDAFSIGYKHIMEEAPEPELRLPEQRELFAVVRRMLAKAPEERFQSADEVVQALEGRAPAVSVPLAAVRASEAATAIIQTPTGGIPGLRPSTPTTPMPKAVPRPTPKKKRRGALVGVLLVLFAGAGGAGGYWYFGMGAQWPPQFGNRPSPYQPPAPGPQEPAELPVALLGDSQAIDSTAQDGGTATIGDTATTVATTLLPDSGVILLRGVPNLATALVDGQRAGSRVTVLPGGHRVTVRQTGYQDWIQTVQVGRGDTVEVAVRLTALPPPATPQCTDPTGEHFNLEQFCYDQAATPAAAALLAAPPGATTRPSAVVIWVRVQADGGPEGAYKWETQSDNPSHTRAALLFATRELRYNPAQKAGRPVAGWARVTVSSRPPG